MKYRQKANKNLNKKQTMTCRDVLSIRTNTYLLPAETDGPPLWVGGGWRVGAHLLVTSGD